MFFLCIAPFSIEKGGFCCCFSVCVEVVLFSRFSKIRRSKKLPLCGHSASESQKSLPSKNAIYSILDVCTKIEVRLHAALPSKVVALVLLGTTNVVRSNQNFETARNLVSNLLQKLWPQQNIWAKLKLLI